SQSCLALSRLDEARRFCSHIINEFKLYRGVRAEALRVLGDIERHSSAQNPSACEEAYREALALSSALGMRPTVAHCQRGLALVYRQQRKEQAARQHQHAAAELYGEMGMTYWLDSMKAETAALD